MKTVILLKNGLCTDEAGRALQTADDMLTQGHTVSLLLLQEAVRFCQPRTECANTARLQKLISRNLQVNVLTTDAEPIEAISFGLYTILSICLKHDKRRDRRKQFRSPLHGLHLNRLPAELQRRPMGKSGLQS
jgi:hypothetical protein